MLISLIMDQIKILTDSANAKGGQKKSARMQKKDIRSWVLTNCSANLLLYILKFYSEIVNQKREL